MRLFPEPTFKNILFALLRIIIGTYIFVGGWIYFTQDAMLYFPDARPFENCLELDDGIAIDMNGTRGYFFKNGTSTKLTVFYHGNAGNACDRAYYRTAIEQAGHSWLFVEYTGYAGDGKKPTGSGMLEDVRRTLAWIKTQEFSSTAVVGESIGSGPASFHAYRGTVERLILITPFERLSAVAHGYYPYLPVKLLLKEDYDNILWAQYAKSVLIVAGGGDTIIPLKHAKHLFDALSQKNKELFVLDGVDHNEVPALGKTQLKILHFLSGAE